MPGPLLGAETPAQQKAVWREILAKGLSVRQTEALVKQAENRQKTGAPRRPIPTGFISRVWPRSFPASSEPGFEFCARGKKGKVEIDFFNDDDPGPAPVSCSKHV